MKKKKSPGHSLDTAAAQAYPQGLLTSAAQIMSRHVAPLYATRRGHPEHVGTCFFVRAEGAHFLVSAAHVIDQAIAESVFYFGPDNVMHIAEGPAATTQGTPPMRSDDPYDVGVIMVTPVGGEFRAPLEVASIDLPLLWAHQKPRQGHRYGVVGYPTSRNKPNPEKLLLVAESFFYLGRPAEPALYQAKNLDEEDHCLVTFERELGYTPDGAPVVFPKPQGMSGAPIFQLDSDLSVEADGLGFCVVGVATDHWKRERVLKGADIGVAIFLIGELLKQHP